MLTAAAVAGLAVAGCSQSEVNVYEIPKEAASVQTGPSTSPGTDPHAGIATDPHGGMGASQTSVQWGELPEGWSLSQQGSGMRLATFVVAGDGDTSAELAIIPMGGFAGTEEQLVNMWRVQLALPELAQADEAEWSAPLVVGGVEGRVYEMAGKAQDTPTRMLVASVSKDGVNYFFKFIGHDTLVASQKDDFLKFLAGMEFTEAATASTPPAVATASSSSATGDQRWTASEGWETLPASQFLLAKYRLPEAGGASALVTVSQLGGSAGGLLPNVNRWRGQMKLAPVDEVGLKPLLSEIKAGNVDATLVTLEGTDPQTGGPGKMLAVIVAMPAETWFFKMTGPVAAVDAKAGEFRSFVNGTRF